MFAILLITTGTLLDYSKSKYFPEDLKFFKSNGWVNLLFIIAGAAILVADRGWASGLLFALCIYMLVVSLSQIALVSIGKLSDKS